MLSGKSLRNFRISKKVKKGNPMIKKIRRLFCRHVFRKRKIPNGFRVVDGWLVPVHVYSCTRCGKKIYNPRKKR